MLFLGAATPLVPLFARFAVWMPRHRRAIADKALVPTPDAWLRTDIALAAAAGGTLVARGAAAVLDVGASLTARSLTAAISAPIGFAAAGYAAPYVKNRYTRPSATHWAKGRGRPRNARLPAAAPRSVHPEPFARGRLSTTR